MATLEDMAARIEKSKRATAQLEERYRKMQAKERAQERKWEEQVRSETGRAVVEALGCGWEELDLAALKAWLADPDGPAASDRPALVSEGRSPKEAKAALDALLRAGRQRRGASAPDAPAEQ